MGYQHEDKKTKQVKNKISSSSEVLQIVKELKTEMELVKKENERILRV